MTPSDIFWAIQLEKETVWDKWPTIWKSTTGKPTGTTTPKTTTTTEQHDFFHKQPRDILTESWGVDKQTTESEEDINANTRDLKAVSTPLLNKADCLSTQLLCIVTSQ